jgi:hypothetical protein
MVADYLTDLEVANSGALGSNNKWCRASNARHHLLLVALPVEQASRCGVNILARGGSFFVALRDSGA